MPEKSGEVRSDDLDIPENNQSKEVSSSLSSFSSAIEAVDVLIDTQAVVEEKRVEKRRASRSSARLGGSTADREVEVTTLVLDESKFSDEQAAKVKAATERSEAKNNDTQDIQADEVDTQDSEESNYEEMTVESEQPRLENAYKYVLDQFLSLGIVPKHVLDKLTNVLTFDRIKLVDTFGNREKMGVSLNNIDYHIVSESQGDILKFAVDSAEDNLDYLFYKIEAGLAEFIDEQPDLNKDSVKVKDLIKEEDLRELYWIRLVGHEIVHQLIQVVRQIDKQKWEQLKASTLDKKGMKLIASLIDSEKTTVEEQLTMSVEKHLTFNWFLNQLKTKSNTELSDEQQKQLILKIIRQDSPEAGDDLVEKTGQVEAKLEQLDEPQKNNIISFLRKSPTFKRKAEEGLYDFRHMPISEVIDFFDIPESA